MKIINFITTINPAQERVCVTWLKSTFLLFLVTTGYITYIQVSQIKVWLSCRSEYKNNNYLIRNYTQIFTEQKNLETQELSLKNQSDIISKKHALCCKQVEQLNVLHSLCTRSANFISCSLNNTKMEITLNCPSIKNAQLCCATLNKNKNNMEFNIISLVQNKDSINATINCFM